MDEQRYIPPDFDRSGPEGNSVDHSGSRIGDIADYSGGWVPDHQSGIAVRDEVAAGGPMIGPPPGEDDDTGEVLLLLLS